MSGIFYDSLSHYGTTKPNNHAEIERIEDLYDKSSDLPIATIIKMAGFVPSGGTS
jgi:hypothetical protein